MMSSNRSFATAIHRLIAACACAAPLAAFPSVAAAQAPSPAPAEQASSPAPSTPPDVTVVAPGPPVFVPPAFHPVIAGGAGDTVPPVDSEYYLYSSPPPAPTPSRFMVQGAAGARYRRLYSGDISAFQLEVAFGARVRPHFHVSAVLLGAMGATNQGLPSRFASAGAEIAFPRTNPAEGIFQRLTPAVRVRFSFFEVERITRHRPITGYGAGVDGQLAADLFREGAHALYALVRVSLDGYFSEPEGLGLTQTVGMWGGEAMLGFRY